MRRGGGRHSVAEQFAAYGARVCPLNDSSILFECQTVDGSGDGDEVGQIKRRTVQAKELISPTGCASVDSKNHAAGPPCGHLLHWPEVGRDQRVPDVLTLSAAPSDY